MHNRWPNATTKQSPHEVLLGYQPSATQGFPMLTNNEAAENRQQLIKEHRTAAVQALNQVAHTKPPTQYQTRDQVWLEAKHLTLPYASAKLAPKRHGPFQIVKEISPVAYQLELPKAWTIHNVFHSSILTPYKETDEHRDNYQCPPPEMIDNAEEFEVKLIINHRYHGKRHQLQYLIRWKGYSAADDTWEPADQVHVPDLVRKYHQRHPLESNKNTPPKTKDKRLTTRHIATASCHPQPPRTSPSTRTRTSSQSPFSSKAKPPLGTNRTLWSSLRKWWLRPPISVSYDFPLAPHAPLSRDIAPAGKNLSSSPEDWLELRDRMRPIPKPTAP